MGYVPPRGPDGKILLDTAILMDDEPEAEPAPTPILQTAPVGSPVSNPAPVRRLGETPTPFGQLRPGGAAPAPAAKPWSWREWLAAAVAVLLGAVGAYAVAMSRPTPAPMPAAAATTSAPAPTTAAPTPTARLALPRAVVAYDAPDGQAVGALEPGRPYVLVEEQNGWRRLDADGSGVVWVRAWEMDGTGPPTPTAIPTAEPTPEPPPPPPTRPAPAVQVIPIGPQVTCVPVLDGDNGDAYLGQACGTTSAERQERALELLQQATPFTP